MEYRDYPLEECAKTAEKLIASGAHVYQKWTCSHCGDRQMMDEPDKFFTEGKCGKCDGTTKITKCNYLMTQVI